MRTIYVFYCWFFFFQAEDGIRDGTVTGVQTCALPICRQLRQGEGRGRFVLQRRRHIARIEREADGHENHQDEEYGQGKQEASHAGTPAVTPAPTLARRR